MDEIILSNSMTAKYRLQQASQSEIEFDYVISVLDSDSMELEYGIIGKGNNEISLNYEVVFGDTSEISLEYQIIVSEFIELQFEVNPNNKMSVLYNLEMPPTVELISYPIQDTYTSSLNPYNLINNGENNSLLVGRNDRGVNTTYIKFDTSEVPMGVLVKEAKVRMYYSQLESSQVITLSEVLSYWGEYNTTHNNRPQPVNYITDVYSVNEEELYIEYDISNLVELWANGATNNGLSLSADSGISIFRSRESFREPVLLIEYYNPNPPIGAISNVILQYEVSEIDESSIALQFEIDNVFEFTQVELSYFVKADDVFEESIEIEFEVLPKPILDSDSEVELEYEVVINTFNTIEFEFEIPNYDDETTIEFEFEIFGYIEDESNVEFEYEVKALYEFESTTVELQFEVASEDGESSIELEYFIIAYGDSNLELQFEVASTDADTEIELTYMVLHTDNSNIELQFEVNQYEEVATLEFEFEVPPRYIDISIELEFGINGYSDTQVDYEYVIRAVESSFAQFEFEINETVNETYVYLI